MFIRRLSGKIFLEILPKQFLLGKNAIWQQSLDKKNASAVAEALFFCLNIF